MLNHVWLGMLVVALLVAGLTGHVRASVEGAIKGVETAVTLALGLVGVMALWLGLMRLAERSGLVLLLSRALRPVLGRLFPDVPAEHPAMGSMVMNIAANMLGLTNAATPLGLRAMRDLESLNRHPGTASNAMCTFLAINTGSVQLIPATAVASLAAAGSAHPTAIVGSTLVATCCSSAAGLIAVKWLEGRRSFRLPEGPADPTARSNAEGAASIRETVPPDGAPASAPEAGSERPLGTWAKAALLALLVTYAWMVGVLVFPEWVGHPVDPATLGQATWIRFLGAVSTLAIPGLLTFFPVYASLRGVPVYEEFVEGAKEGFQVALRVIPFLVAMLVAIGFLRGAGAIEGFTRLLRVPMEAVGFPPELLPISLIRPLSGSASLAAFMDVVKTHGADSLLARTAGTLFGSTETTFYVIAVYFGSVGIRRARHAVWAGLTADAAGVIASVLVCRAMFGSG